MLKENYNFRAKKSVELHNINKSDLFNPPKPKGLNFSCILPKLSRAQDDQRSTAKEYLNYNDSKQKSKLISVKKSREIQQTREKLKKIKHFEN